MKLIWISDIHLNFLKFEERCNFYKKLKDSEGDIVVVSGDIAESHNVIPLLMELKFHSEKEVFFVLGNHDFYGSSVTAVKRSVRSLGYLGSKQIVELGESTALIGVDGWGDCRFGDYENSRLHMADWSYIEELKVAYHQDVYTGSQKLLETLQQFADGDAAKLAKNVRKAIKTGFKRIIIVTHVPPFEEACLYAGRKSTPDGLPFFASKILGDTILPIAKRNPKVDFLWLSGHTHSRVVFHALENLVVKVAKAEYYFPQIEEVILI